MRSDEHAPYASRHALTVGHARVQRYERGRVRDDESDCGLQRMRAEPGVPDRRAGRPDHEQHPYARPARAACHRDAHRDGCDDDCDRERHVVRIDRIAHESAVHQLDGNDELREHADERDRDDEHRPAPHAVAPASRGNVADDERSGSVALDVKRAAAIGHAARERGGWARDTSTAVVGDRDREVGRRAPQRYLEPGRVRVLQRVGDGLRRGEPHRALHLGREVVATVDVDGDRQPRGEHQGAQRAVEPALGQQGGRAARRNREERRRDLVGCVGNFGGLGRSPAVGARQQGRLQAEPDQRLLRAIVQVALELPPGAVLGVEHFAAEAAQLGLAVAGERQLPGRFELQRERRDRGIDNGGMHLERVVVLQRRDRFAVVGDDGRGSPGTGLGPRPTGEIEPARTGIADGDIGVRIAERSSRAPDASESSIPASSTAISSCACGSPTAARAATPAAPHTQGAPRRCPTERDRRPE